MELLIESISEFFVEGIIYIIKNKKISKFIRYPLAAILLLIYTAIIILMIYYTFKLSKENLFFSFICLLVSVLLILSLIICIKKQVHK